MTIASLFPNSTDSTHGIFVYQRVIHMARLERNEAKVVAPLPYFPRWLKLKRWRATAQVPAEEEFGGLTVYHPRYFLLPKISMLWQGLSVFLRCLPRVRAIHRKWKVDCVDAHYVYPDGFAAVLLGKYLGVPVIVSARGSDINLLPTFRGVRSMIRWTLEQAAAVVSVSSALKDVMVGLGADGNKIHVVPNGVDPARFQSISAAEARRSLGLPESGAVIVSVGSLIPSKGNELVIRALARMGRENARTQLYILGDGPLRGFLEKLVEELSLRDAVHFLGKRPNEELPLWFNAATVSCLASSREGWPNVVTESLACGTPVVATRVGGVPEILHSEELGILVEQTVDSVADGLARALAKKWDRAAISSQTRERTWQRVAEELESIFKAEVARFEAGTNKSTRSGIQNAP
ncbi:MAG: glycosyltransferase family 4 protein [Candidatus Acidiferrum sp.]